MEVGNLVPICLDEFLTELHKSRIFNSNVGYYYGAFEILSSINGIEFYV